MSDDPDTDARNALRLIGPDPANWVPDRPGIDHNVAIVGGGQTGCGLAFALRRAGIGKVTGGRSGVGSEFVGNVVAPAAGLVDDVWRAVQNTKEGTDPHDLLKTLPFNRHPLLIPAINALGD